MAETLIFYSDRDMCFVAAWKKAGATSFLLDADGRRALLLPAREQIQRAHGFDGHAHELMVKFSRVDDIFRSLE